MTRNCLLFCGLLLVNLARMAAGNYVVNGSMTGTPGLQTLPPAWERPSSSLWYTVPSTIAPGGFANDDGVLGPSIPASPDGGTFIALTSTILEQGDAAAQDISGLEPGAKYTVSFYYTNVGFTLTPDFPPEIVPEPGAMVATIAGQSFTTDDVAYEGAGAQTWRLATFAFQATRPVEKLVFEPNRPFGFFGGIDGVVIVPEPASLTLLSSALPFGAVCLIRTRKRRR